MHLFKKQKERKKNKRDGGGERGGKRGGKDGWRVMEKRRSKGDRERQKRGHTLPGWYVGADVPVAIHQKSKVLSVVVSWMLCDFRTVTQL